jgi:hypothetical protein
MSRKVRLCFPCGWGVFLLLVITGCGGPRLYPVEGTIEFPDHQAARELAGGSVEFDPVDGKASARGIIEADGRFRMSTYQPGDGVLPGTYRVCIQPPLPALDRPARRVIGRRYEDPLSSGLTVTVKAENNQIVLPVERVKPKPP